MDGKRISEFREKLNVFYRNVFNTQDPGFLSLASHDCTMLSLEERYIFPDIYEKKDITISRQQEPRAEKQEVPAGTELGGASENKNPNVLQATSIESKRRSVESWLAQNNHSVILGEPGSGKSSLLRFIAMDILKQEPQFGELAKRFGQYLPVWVPFGLWTTIIEKETTQANALQDILKSWLERWNEGGLWPLVEAALKDDRLLLLVDGLDEWANITAGQVAFDRLQVFIRQRNVPSIVTSRPLGFEQLGNQFLEAQIARLANLSKTQQEELARIWFTYWTNTLSGTQGNENQGRANNSCEEFLIELTSSPDISELAQIPLLLVLLINLWIKGNRLPIDRFKAYEAFIDCLIVDHPNRRRRDLNQIQDAVYDFTPDDIKGVLANLAYVIQKNWSEGAIEKNEAKGIVRDYLKDDKLGFGYELPDANRCSNQLLKVSEEDLGLLVCKSPNEVGFFHRSFLEYLTAYHISRLSLDEAVEHVKEHSLHVQWRETILGLFQITTRTSDIEEFVKAIQENISNPVEEDYMNVLLSEIAFGNYNCPIKRVKSIAEKCFGEIEFGSWMPLRQKLIKIVINGLHTSKTRDIVKVKLRKWFPKRIGKYLNLFEVLTTWPKCPEVIECLFKGIHSEDAGDKTSSAFSLAHIAKGEAEVGNRLAELAKNAIDPQVRASALQALVKGWPDNENIAEIVAHFQKSVCPELNFAAIFSKIERGEHSEADIETLLSFTSIHGSLSYGWSPDVPSLILKARPNCPKIKKVCLSNLKESSMYEKKVSTQAAQWILLKGYSQDEQVAEFIANQFKNEKYPFLLSHHGFAIWRLLKDNFKDHPKLVDVIDTWLVSAESEPEISFAALVGRTETAKNKLISNLGTGFRFWAAGSLLDGWGMKDGEVGSCLNKIAYAPIKEASAVARLLPQIIENKDECRKRLVELLKHKDCSRLDFVVDGLMKLGDLHQNSFVIDEVLSVIESLGRDVARNESLISNLIENCPWDARVRELAKNELHQRWGSYASVAKAYGDDDEIRNMLIEIINPLPTPLRLTIAKQLGNEIENIDFAISLLQHYDSEPDDIVKTEASISYHKLLKLSGQDTSNAIKQLSKDIMCYGVDYEERRQAAFCGLLTLERLDIMNVLKETIGDKTEACSIPLKLWNSNIGLFRQIAKNWNEIKSVFGKDFWRRINRHGGESMLAWDNLCLFAHEHSSVKQDAIDFIERAIESDDNILPNILKFISDFYPRSELLAKCCLNILLSSKTTGRGGAYTEMFLAAKLLGEQFAGDKIILGKLTEQIRHNYIPEPILLALCYGWRDSQELKNANKNSTDRLDYGVAVKLACTNEQSARVFALLGKIINKCENDNSLLNILGFRNVSHSIVFRFKEDEVLRGMLWEKLDNKPTPSEKISFTRLLYAAEGLSEKLRKWIIKELCCQTDSNYPEVGVDLFALKLLPVSHSLRAVLEQ